MSEFIYLKDESIIRMIPAHTSQRGQRLSASYILHPEHIGKDVINEVIKPITIMGERSVFILDTDDEEKLWRQIWYNRKEYRFFASMYL